MPMRKTALVCAMALLVLSSPLLADGKQEFDQASQKFAAGNYQQAIPLFQQARARGYNPHVIDYNLGVSYYKLGDYKNAEKAFLRAVKSQKLRQIVEYNIGLVYNKLGHEKASQAWFKAAANSKRYGKLYNPKIGNLAQRQISRPKTASRKTRPTKTASALDRLDGIIRLAYGHDDDVTDPATNNATSISDTFTETYAYLKVKFDYVHLKLALYEKNYSEVNPSDFDQQEIALSYPVKTRFGRFTPSVHLIYDGLDHKDYLDTTDLRLTYRYRFDKNHTLKARYRYSDIESPRTIYNYLEGTRHQLRIDNLLGTAFGKLRLRYEYETNDRQNLPNDNYSPDRHTFRARLKNKLPYRLRMKNEINYRTSEYGADTNGVRKDDRLRYQLNLYYFPIRDLEVGLQYQRTDNDSTDVSRDYLSNVYQTYLFWYF